MSSILRCSIESRPPSCIRPRLCDRHTGQRRGGLQLCPRHVAPRGSRTRSDVPAVFKRRTRMVSPPMLIRGNMRILGELNEMPPAGAGVAVQVPTQCLLICPSLSRKSQWTRCRQVRQADEKNWRVACHAHDRIRSSIEAPKIKVGAMLSSAADAAWVAPGAAGTAVQHGVQRLGAGGHPTICWVRPELWEPTSNVDAARSSQPSAHLRVPRKTCRPQGERCGAHRVQPRRASLPWPDAQEHCAVIQSDSSP